MRKITYTLFLFWSLCASLWIYAYNVEKTNNMQNTVKMGLKTDSIQLGYDRIEKVKNATPKKIVQKDEEVNVIIEVLKAITLFLLLPCSIAGVLFLVGLICILLTSMYKRFC